jgi:methenyltetrahydrofolate cyclohydrolase
LRGPGGPDRRAPRPLGEGTSVEAWADALAAPTAAPGGGTAAAIAAGLAAAVVRMVAGMTARRPQYAAGHAAARAADERAGGLCGELLALAARDARAVGRLVEALALPTEPEDARERREDAKRAALLEAARAQFDLLRGATDVVELAEEMVRVGAASAVSDAATAAFLGGAAARSAAWAVRSDLRTRALGGTEGSTLDPTALLERAEAAERRVSDLVHERLSRPAGAGRQSVRPDG